jgi:hypothetical protein
VEDIRKPSALLRTVLVIAGLVMIALGLNVGLGGIRTLGLQVPGDFLQVTDAAVFASQDSHVRFLGGFWLGAGLLMASGSLWFERLQSLLIAICAMAFLGGVMRLTAHDPAIVLVQGLLPSVVAELLGFPLLGVWISRQ